MTDPALDTSGPKPAVRLERYLPDPPPVVWQAITDRVQLSQWFPCGVVVAGGRWEVGAPITFPFPPDVIDMTLTGTVLAVDEPRLLSYTWGTRRSSPSSCTRRARVPGWCSPIGCGRAGPRGTPPAGRTASTGSPGCPPTRARGPAGSPPAAPPSSRYWGRRRGRRRNTRET
jgi:hypothetical protein